MCVYSSTYHGIVVRIIYKKIHSPVPGTQSMLYTCYLYLLLSLGGIWVGSREEGDLPVGGHAGRREQGSRIRTRGTMLGKHWESEDRTPWEEGTFFL